MITSLDLRVADADIDALEHVNHARFLDYLERARGDWYSRTGLAALLRGASTDTPAGHDQTASTSLRRLGTVVVNININFRRELFRNQAFWVTTRPHSRRRTSYVLSQAIRNEAGDDVCDAEVTCVVMDLESRRAVAVPHVLGRCFPPQPG